MSVDASMNAVEVGQWLAEKGRREIPVGLVIAGDWVRLSAERESRSLLLTQEEVTGAILKAAFTSTWPINIVVRDRRAAASLLGKITNLERAEVSARILGDMTTIENATGMGMTRDSSELVEAWQMADTVAVMPKYYKAVGEPFAKLMCQPLAPGKGWSVTYRNLLAKVIAHGSNEPLLQRPNELGDPADNLREALEEEFGKDAIGVDTPLNVLVYAALAFDGRKLPEGFLPAEPKVMDPWLDLTIPIVRSTTTGYYLGSMNQLTCATLYGRKMVVDGNTKAAAIMDHMYRGTVKDLIAVACVSFANNGASVKVPTFEGYAKAITIHGTIPDDRNVEWLSGVKDIASLLHPLGMQLLNPEVGYD